MKKIQIALVLALLHWTLPCSAQPSAPDAPAKKAADEDEAVRLTDNNILFFYEANADIPSPLESVAKSYSEQYRNAPTEFAKADVLKQITPVIERKIGEAKDTKDVMVSIGCRIADYDFARKGFDTTMTAESFVPFNLVGGNYAVAFKGIKKFSFLPLAEEKASQFQTKLARSRDGQVQIFGTVSGAEEQSLGGYERKTVFIKVHRLVFGLSDGTILGEINLPAK